MPKFTLIAEHDDAHKITYEFNKDYLPEVLQDIELFLRGVGFFFDGQLDFVNDFDEQISLTELGQQVMEEFDHDPSYFDIQRNR